MSSNRDRVRANEAAIPVLPCVDVDATIAFYEALGFAVTYRMTKPYLYLAFAWSGFEVHYGRAPKGVDPTNEDAGGCLVMVDSVAPYHRAFTQAMRNAYGKVLAKGRPRITRYRPGASRFTLVDPNGNSLIFIQRGEPVELEYGGSQELAGLPKALDNARILREFKTDDRAALRHLTSALRRHGDQAPAIERALVLATMIELCIALEDADTCHTLTADLKAIPLTAAEQQRVATELALADDLETWLGHASARSQQ